MILIAIFLILGATFGGMIGGEEIENDYTTLKKIWMYFLGGFLGILVAIVLCGVVLMFGSIFVDGDSEFSHDNEIISINDGSSLNGSFILGSGYINDELVYNYYRKTNNGGMVRRQVDAYRVEIFEIDSLETPIIKTYIVPSWNGGLWFPLNGRSNKENYEIYLPKGSVIKEIKLDNQ